MGSRTARACLALALVFALVPAIAGASSARGGAADKPAAHRIDDRPSPLSTRQRALRAKALEAKLNGKAYGKVAQVGRGQFVQLAQEGTSPVWTLLGEFSDFPHNNIAEPNRAFDNSTIWEADFSRALFNTMLYSTAPGANSMANYFAEQSSCRYTVKGDATEWVTVPGTAESYDDSPDANVWSFLRDSLNGWYDAQIAAGKTPAQIEAYLATFDVEDRYDYDGDGDFNEPDGYIDHFQSVHAGEGEEAGGGALGSKAIWSHSWYAFSGLMGTAGPDFNKLGGLQVGNSTYWVNKYTIQPENGGVGVFVHEFSHDLGIPDLYDTNDGENGTGFWTLMSSGSWLSDGTMDIGSKPGHLGAWEKYQLGWLNYDVAYAGKRSDHKLGPAETNTKQAQGLFVILPKKTVVSNIGAPFAGTKYYYSGSGDGLDHYMYKSVNLAAGSTLAAKVKTDIELDWDYAYVVVSTDGGTTWTSVETNLSTTTDPNGQNFGFGITGTSSGWVDLTADLSAYTGDVLVGFRYWTDEAAIQTGFMADEITITGYATDGAETDAGWTFKPATGFRVTSGVESGLFSHYYVAENRQYRGYDATLKTGPYNFGFLNDDTKGNWVERFPYQDGVLVSYWDTSQGDNNTSAHPGSGLLLPIDARPKALIRPDGKVWRNRVQTFDATFSLDRTDAIRLHFMSMPFTQASQPAQPVFDDRTMYYDTANPTGSVRNPNTNTQIRVISYNALGNFLQLQVRPSR